jgi:hypothetical protein
MVLVVGGAVKPMRVAAKSMMRWQSFTPLHACNTCGLIYAPSTSACLARLFVDTRNTVAQKYVEFGRDITGDVEAMAAGRG